MKILITGGCGFIGSNLAHRFLKNGHEVIVYDNLSRHGVERNKEWLEDAHKDGLQFVIADIRDFEKIKKAAKNIDAIFHTAAQVTMTDSVRDPRTDFEINALGTFNVLEAARLSGNNPILIYTSTNKVYGNGTNIIPLLETKTRWEFADRKYLNGISETFSTDFDQHGPYGDSKYTGDLYVRDYAHVFGLPTVTFRQSCIYGPRQFGHEDQGWVAHLLINSILGHPITIYGDGKQVRDALFIDDLVNAFELAVKHIDTTKGKAYNIGGGPAKTLSLLELVSILEKFNKIQIPLNYSDWRPADQKIYISDISRAKNDFHWEPKVTVQEGISKLHEWVTDNITLFSRNRSEDM